jgi:phenylacetate-CoA ligase
MLLQPGADRQPRAQLARAREGGVIYSAIEAASRDERAALQLERLRAVAGPEVRSLDDLRSLPFTTKADLRASYPLGRLAVPREQVVRIHASSGTGGKPTIVAYTRADLEVWTEVMARTLAGAGVRAGMVVHNAYGYGLFTGGLGFHQGAERLGATVVPVSGGVTARQATLLRDLRAQVLCCTPSYALHVAQALREADVGHLALEVGLFGAEPWTPALRAQLEAQLGLVALNVYGLSEIVGPGVAAECREGRDGSHVQEDHFLVEVIDPATEQPVAPGALGELVFTTLTKEALPLVRYRTGDICSLDEAPCVCGRTTVRMGPVRGRRDDMLIVRGVNLYPSEIEHVLLSQDGIAPHYQIVVERPVDLDELTVRCEPLEAGGDRAALAARVRHALYEGTGVGIAVELLDPGAVPRSEGKAVRVLDRRGA